MKSPAKMKIVQIDVTNACPKRCSNCTRFCGHHQEPFFMDFDTFKRAVDSMRGFGGIVGIMGGEPTIHPEFERFVEHYREQVGYDDFSSACYRPVSDFSRHVYANVYDIGYHNHRGLLTNLSPKYYEHFELIQDTFGFQLVNDHSSPCQHQTLMATRRELGIPDEQWIRLRDKCWIQNLWSASITPKGAFFCEVAAAMDMTLHGPGGWPIEPGWWKRTPADFADQLHWCEMCSAPLPMPSRNANEEIDEVSPVWREKLVQIGSPKLNKGLVRSFDPADWDPRQNRVIAEATPYLKDQQDRVGLAEQLLRPHRICHVAWIEKLGRTEAEALLRRLADEAHLDGVLSDREEIKSIADNLSIPFALRPSGGEAALPALLREQLGARDWVLLMRDSFPSAAEQSLRQTCIFNPGCLYQWRGEDGRARQLFFNLRAAALRGGTKTGPLEVCFAPRKLIWVEAESRAAYDIFWAGVVRRRIIKRLHWLRQRIGIRLGMVPRVSLSNDCAAADAPEH